MYFQADPDCPVLPELQGLLIKTAGIVDVLREPLEPFAARIEWAFIYGSVARTEELASSDIDLMLISAVGLAELAPALHRAEQRLSRPVNPTLYTREEFATKLQAGHHFLKSVLDGETLFILGSSHELAAVTRHPPGATPHHEPPRA